MLARVGRCWLAQSQHESPETPAHFANVGLLVDFDPSVLTCATPTNKPTFSKTPGVPGQTCWL